MKGLLVTVAAIQTPMIPLRSSNVVSMARARLDWPSEVSNRTLSIPGTRTAGGTCSMTGISIHLSQSCRMLTACVSLGTSAKVIREVIRNSASALSDIEDHETTLDVRDSDDNINPLLLGKAVPLSLRVFRKLPQLARLRAPSSRNRDTRRLVISVGRPLVRSETSVSM